MATPTLDTEKNTNALSPGQFGTAYDPFSVGKNLGVPGLAAPKPGSVAAIPTPPPAAPTPLVNPPGALFDRNTGAPIPPAPGSVNSIQPGYNLTLTPEQLAAKNAGITYLTNNTNDANQNIDPAAIYQNNLAQFQSSIDATNKIYSDKLNAARIEGQGRIESRQFSQGRSGQIGSGTGEAGVNAVQDANTTVENSIRDEQNNAIQGILGQVRTASTAELAAKTAAKKAGADALLTFYDNQPARKAAALAPVISTLVGKGIDPSKMTPEDLASITNGLGVSKEDVISAYNTSTLAAAAVKTKAAKDAADLANTEATTKKTNFDITNWGKMTDEQKAQNAVEWYKAKNPTGTDAAKKASAMGTIASELNQTTKLPDGSTPVLDSNNKITPPALAYMITNGAGLNLTKEELLKQFGQFLYIDPKTGEPSSSYQLSPADLKVVTGALPTN